MTSQSRKNKSAMAHHRPHLFRSSKCPISQKKQPAVLGQREFGANVGFRQVSVACPKDRRWPTALVRRLCGDGCSPVGTRRSARRGLGRLATHSSHCAVREPDVRLLRSAAAVGRPLERGLGKPNAPAAARRRRRLRATESKCTHGFQPYRRCASL